MADLEGKTLLVTGGNGFVGSHLLAALAELVPARLHATYLGKEPSQDDNSKSRQLEIHWHPLDITDRRQTATLIAAVRPDIVFHLAAQSHIPTSFANPDLTWQVNLHGTLHLLSALNDHCPNATVIHVGSSDMYGANFHSAEPITESAAFMPLNPYAASKAAADLAAFQHGANTDLKILRARPFNHSGPGQGEGFVLPSFAAQIARIEHGRSPPVMKVGDLAAERDFLHVADVIDAYIAMALHADRIESGTAFNIASGNPVTIQSLLQQFLNASDCRIITERDPSRLRPADILRVCGDSRTLTMATGWQPRRSHATLIDDLLTYWRSRVLSEPGT
ncbi:MAG: GDP-mannose 4,6-dehydratase [Porticoccaceae bacterium]|jgi:GDP-4-dehydro-6-deoxy-D-mannose reductase|nr:GDP-mannose 4,6-dehydratase [Porticoccaceae bacterium]